jgi:hypothetical protein
MVITGFAEVYSIDTQTLDLFFSSTQSGMCRIKQVLAKIIYKHTKAKFNIVITYIIVTGR